MKNHHHSPIFITVLCVLPFILMNLLVTNHIQWFIDFLRPSGHTTLLEYMLLFGSLLLVFVGGLVSLSPLIHKRKAKEGHPVLSIIVGIFLIVTSLILLGSFSKEVYRCEVSNAPMCD